MGKTDHLTRKYWHDHPESFAEAFNVFVFGKKIIDPKLLRPLDPNFLYRSNGAIREKQRDNLRSAEVRQYGNSFLVLLGIEDSSYVDYTAPVRQMMYDSLSYLRQISAFRKDALRGDEWLSGFPKTGKLHPVCTLYYYWGNRKWDGPRSLHDMIDSDLLDLFQNGISDYPLNIVVPGEVKEIQLMKMETSQKEILGYLKDSSSLERLQRRIRMDGFRYRDIEADVFELINQVTGSRLVLEPFKTAEGGVDMCEAIDQMRRKIERGEEFERMYQTKSIEWEETNRQMRREIERGEEFERMYHAASKKCDELNKKYSDASRIVRKLEDRLRASGISEEEIKALKD